MKKDELKITNKFVSGIAKNKNITNIKLLSISIKVQACDATMPNIYSTGGFIKLFLLRRVQSKFNGGNYNTYSILRFQFFEDL
ncbi:hypothetical protein BH10BAC2_BH10BAC2_10780 [soil metagenome]